MKSKSSKPDKTIDVSKYYIPIVVVIALLISVMVILPAPKLSSNEKNRYATNELGSPMRSVELTNLEYSILSKIGLGSRTYTITYEDGTFINRIIKGGLLTGYILTVPERVEVPVGGTAGDGKVDVTLFLDGVSCSLSGSSSSNQHTYSFAYDSLQQKKFFSSIITLPCGKMDDHKFTISGWGTENAINKPGEYTIYIEDKIYLPSGTIVTDHNFFYLGVTGTVAPAPVSTPTPTSEGSIRVTSNVPGAVYIDGTGVGLSGNTFPVMAGGHDIKVVTSGYTVYTKSVTVDYGSSVLVSAFLSKIAPPVPTVPTPVPTIPKLVPTASTSTSTSTISTPAPTTAVATVPSQPTPEQTGGMTLETEPLASGGGATITYEEESLLNGTNVLIVLVIGVILVVGYMKLYVQKERGKRRK